MGTDSTTLSWLDRDAKLIADARFLAAYARSHGYFEVADTLEALLRERETVGLPPLGEEGALWLAAIDRVPIDERIGWVARMKEQVDYFNERRTGLPANSHRVTSIYDVLKVIDAQRMAFMDAHPQRIKIAEPHLRYLAEKAGVGFPKARPSEPATLFGVPVFLDDSLGDRIVVE